MADPDSEEISEERLALYEALGIDPKAMVVTFEVQPEYLESQDSTALYVVLVEGERVIVVGHGWGASGAHVDVSCFAGVEPAPVEPVVLEVGGTVMIVNPKTYDRPQ